MCRGEMNWNTFTTRKRIFSSDSHFRMSVKMIVIVVWSKFFWTIIKENGNKNLPFTRFQELHNYQFEKKQMTFLGSKIIWKKQLVTTCIMLKSLLFIFLIVHRTMIESACVPPVKYYVDCNNTRTLSQAMSLCFEYGMTLLNVSNSSSLFTDISLLNSTLTAANCYSNFWFSSGNSTGYVGSVATLGDVLAGVLGGLLGAVGQLLGSVLGGTRLSFRWLFRNNDTTTHH